MGYRRKARECALQMLFQLDINDAESEARVRRQYWQSNASSPDPVREYADRLVEGVVDKREAIDARTVILADDLLSQLGQDLVATLLEACC